MANTENEMPKTTQDHPQHFQGGQQVSDDNYNIDYLLGIASHVEDKGMEEDFLDAEHIRLAAELIERFRKERDEARREVCKRVESASCLSDGEPTTTASDYARWCGWDCFKEDGKPCQ